MSIDQAKQHIKIKAIFNCFELGLSQPVPPLADRDQTHLSSYNEDVLAGLNAKVACLYDGKHAVSKMKRYIFKRHTNNENNFNFQI